VELFRRQRIGVVVLVAAIAVTSAAVASGVNATVASRARMLAALDLEGHLTALRVWMNRASTEALGATLEAGLGDAALMAEDHERTRTELQRIQEHAAGEAVGAARIEELATIVDRRIAAERAAIDAARRSGLEGARAALAGASWGADRRRVREITSELLAASERAVEQERTAYASAVIWLQTSLGAGVALLVVTLLYLVAQLRAVRRARGEALLASSLARQRLADLEGVLDTVPAAVLIARDPECREIRGNRFAELLLRAEPGSDLAPVEPGEGLRGARFRRNEKDLPARELPLQLAARDGVEVVGAQLDLVQGGGSHRHLLGTAHPLRDPSGARRGAVGAFVDVTEMVRVAHELLATLEENRKLLTSAHRNELLHREMARNFPNGAIALFDHDLRFLIFDGTQFAMPRDAATNVGRTLSEIFPPEITTRIEPVHREALRGHQGRTEVVINGRNIEIRASPIRDEQGKVIMGIATSQDVTEERALRTQLAVSSRLASLGTLVAGVAHEVNNPLAGALGSLSTAIEEQREISALVRNGGPLDREVLARQVDEVVEILLDAQVGGQRISRIVKDLSLFGRPNPMRSLVRLGDVVTSAMRWLPASVGRNATVRVDDLGAPAVHASSGQLEQVVVNLVTNAAFAIPEGRRGEVTVSIFPSASGGALMEVRDDGSGIEPATMDRIFDPFFTTREVGQGMGLGLPICHAIVAAHGGTLTATSVPGKGSTFRVELPSADTHLGAASPEPRV
jgi:signal transduction histidine kinase